MAQDPLQPYLCGLCIIVSLTTVAAICWVYIEQYIFIVKIDLDAAHCGLHVHLKMISTCITIFDKTYKNFHNNYLCNTLGIWLIHTYQQGINGSREWNHHGPMMGPTNTGLSTRLLPVSSLMMSHPWESKNNL